MSRTAMAYLPMARRHTGFTKPTIAVTFWTPKRCLVMLAAGLVLGTVTLQCLFSVRHAFSDMHLRTDIDGELVVISPDIADDHDAVCLDGKSLPGYYIKRGIDEGEDKWLIVIPHSIWCNTLAECLSGSRVPLEGTMEGAPVTYQFSGILSSDPADNKYFSDWNMVRLISCDGSSFLGNSRTPLTGDYKQLRLRGAANLMAILDHLIASTTILHARELVLYGEKSGAVSALAYSDYIGRKIPRIHKFVTLLDSGLLFDVQKPHDNLKDFFSLHQLKSNMLLRDCANVSCLHADVILSKRMRKPTIVFTSDSPAWPLATLYGCRDRDVCVEAESYRLSILKLHSTKNPAKNLVTILTSCDWPIKTTATNHDPDVDGVSIYDILVAALQGRSSAPLHVSRDRCKRFDDPTGGDARHPD